MEELTRGPQRELSVVTSEIRDLCRQARQMMLIYAAEIGRRLVEAKEIVPRGEWADYLKELGFKQRTAENHMQIFRAYGSEQVSLFGAELKSQTFANISYSAALKLLAIPEEEREDFIKDNDIENKSTREIDALIKERNAAIAQKEAALDSVAEARKQISRLLDQKSAALREKDAAVRRSEEHSVKILELEERLNNLPPAEATPEQIAAIEDEAAAKYAKEIEKLKKQRDAADKKVKKLTASAAETESKIKDATAELEEKLRKAEIEKKKAREREESERAENEKLRAENEKLRNAAAADEDAKELNKKFGAIQSEVIELLDLAKRVGGGQYEKTIKETIRALVE